jgi:TonB family protein
MLKPDSTRSSSAFQPRISGPEWIEADSAEAVSESHLGRAFTSREDLPSDVAFDLRLHEILQQARLTTAANGAVIALARGDRMVCRATLGDKAPSVGVSMNTRSGLSGACVQSREMQLCDDSLADPRVNAMACRDLGIRSIVVLPVLSSGELWGLLEVFSSIPRAFSDSDLQSLQSLSRKISRTVQEAIQGGSRVVASGAFVQPELEPAVSAIPLSPNPAERYSQEAVPRDYRTGVLTVAVLALAVFLGWMVGRVGWSMAVNRAPIQVPLASEEPQTASHVTPNSPRVPSAPTEVPAPAQPVASSPNVPESPKPAAKAKPEIAKPSEPRGGLVVYEHGKVVFRMPDESETSANAESGVVGSGAIQKAATREDDGSVSPVPSSSPLGNGYLLERVEPQYPETAKQQGIQGPVMLHALVGADGAVKELSVISGDPQLVKAATDAVRQWRFKPHQLKGKAVEFETRITVNFALPE